MGVKRNMTPRTWGTKKRRQVKTPVRRSCLRSRYSFKVWCVQQIFMLLNNKIQELDDIIKKSCREIYSIVLLCQSRLRLLGWHQGLRVGLGLGEDSMDIYRSEERAVEWGLQLHKMTS